MKKTTTIITAILLVTIASVILNTYVVAAPTWHPGHHGPRGHYYHGHHRPYWDGGFGPGVVVDRSPVVAGYGCYLVKRCYINEFGQPLCRWMEVCD